MDSEEQIHPDSEADGSPLQGSGDIERPLIIQSRDLLQDRREVWIEHGDVMYRLRVTSSGKLYLTK